MAKIINPSLRDIELPTRHIVPRKGTLETTNEVLRCPDNAQFLHGQSLSGALTVIYDPDPSPDATPPQPQPAPASIPAPEAQSPVLTDAPETRQKKG